jgi:hypothetical protein
MVVRPWPSPRIFRFFSAFEERERGNAEPLREVQAAFLAAADR